MKLISIHIQVLVFYIFCFLLGCNSGSNHLYIQVKSNNPVTYSSHLVFNHQVLGKPENIEEKKDDTWLVKFTLPDTLFNVTKPVIIYKESILGGTFFDVVSGNGGKTLEYGDTVLAVDRPLIAIEDSATQNKILNHIRSDMIRFYKLVIQC